MAPTTPHTFEFSYTDEPHATRRRAITGQFPSVARFYGYNAMFKYKALFGVAAQCLMAYLVADMPWWTVIFLAYAVGGTINHAMTLALHETSHNLAFSVGWMNRIFGVIVNLPLGIPAFASFQRYHKDHHSFQGVEVIDTDVPTAAEGQIFTSAAAKILWILLQPGFYALRPLITAPKKPALWEAINISAQVAFDAAVFVALGPRSLVYLVLGTLLGMGLHPMAGHFIAEHYTFIRGQETYSYYGPLNWFSFNVGYHNEHHDFPTVSGAFPLSHIFPGMYISLEIAAPPHPPPKHTRLFPSRHLRVFSFRHGAAQNPSAGTRVVRDTAAPLLLGTRHLAIYL